MKHKFLFLILLFELQAQTIIHGGNVNGLWTIDNSPYLVQGEITILSEDELVIEPGVRVEFDQHACLNINGEIKAVGTEQDSIKFTESQTSGPWSVS
ncbi:MAG: hypothetical protein JXR48_10755 [Candidatus Delongbacteria bacterium]|nr:hypothetical protein [Candidatus Delongbacteria bacterium]MBN2835432.1 hypothetical protein [Candidatus Delongbacteria bacterium]